MPALMSSLPGTAVPGRVICLPYRSSQQSLESLQTSLASPTHSSELLPPELNLSACLHTKATRAAPGTRQAVLRLREALSPYPLTTDTPEPDLRSQAVTELALLEIKSSSSVDSHQRVQRGLMYYYYYNYHCYHYYYFARLLRLRQMTIVFI